MSSSVSHQNGSAGLRPRAVPDTKKVEDVLLPAQIDKLESESRYVPFIIVVLLSSFPLMLINLQWPLNPYPRRCPPFSAFDLDSEETS